MSNRGIHTQPNNGESVEWLTPPEIVRALGPFNLDPCASYGQFYRTAKRMIAPPDDGLSVKWRGRVWLNPPYGDELVKWLSRLAEHGNGIALVPARTEVVEWFWPYVWEAADAVLFRKSRIHFRLPYDRERLPNGRKPGNAGHGSVFVAYGERNVRALLTSGIEGQFVNLRSGATWR